MLKHGINYSQLTKKYSSFTPLQTHLLNKICPNPNELELFLNDDVSHLPSPFLLPDMEGAIQLIQDSVAKKKHILLYGDRDTDGVSSTSLMAIFLRDYHVAKGGKLTVKTSSANEDYGLCEKAVKYVKQIKPDLLITLDFGSTNDQEIDDFASQNISVITLDHHEIPTRIPKCFLINPKREDSIYPEKRICTSVLALKLISAIYIKDSLQTDNNLSNNELGLKPNLQKLDMPSFFQKNPNILNKVKALADLASIGTITDMMPLVGENRIIVKTGLKTLSEPSYYSRSDRKGLARLIQELKLNPSKIISKDLGWSIGPALNAAGRMGKTEVALNLLLELNDDKVAKNVQDLLALNQERKERTKRNLDRVQRYFLRKPERTQNKVIFCYEPDMEPGVSGIVATKLIQEYKKPAVFITPDHGNARGSVRSYSKENVIELLKLLSDLFIHYGGHPEAGGFSIEISKIPVLEKKLKEVEEQWLASMADLRKEEIIESEIAFKPEELKESIYKELSIFEPFGQENPQTLLSVLDAKVINFRTMSEGQHVRFNIIGCSPDIKFVLWNRAKELEASISRQETIQLWGRVEENYFNGNVSIQFMVEHFS